MPAPQRAGQRGNSICKRSQKAVARGRREQLQIEQGKKIDSAKLAVPGWRRGNPRADGQVGPEKLGDLALSWCGSYCLLQRSILLAGRRLCVCALLLDGTGMRGGRHGFKLSRNSVVLKLAVHLPALSRVLGVDGRATDQIAKS